ncbi:sialate O-acetylesterase [Fulvivirgaceae bacterium BMA12]|uniref:Sialate O-acetylesterase n=1 Tax=Agaribacillus aureus TaxID=3051825 RepID=A0ABT8LKY2_9BACT|nr:sialate O-acetylesterase [Fulvivirgaceae bacterium BMA12]
MFLFSKNTFPGSFITNTGFLSIAITLLMINPLLAAVKLPKIFQSQMVLQRNQPIAVWGWASPGEKVSVQLNGTSESVKTAANGKWKLHLPAMKAGGPYIMEIKGKNKLTLSDVLIGDVWICGGQSNMQWRIDQTDFKEQDTAMINNTEIRLFTTYIEMDYMPQGDIKGTGWKSLSRESINEFSAVAYHFGKYLHRELNVPLGLISDNLGATSIETWMSNEALMQFPQFASEIGDIVKRGKSFQDLKADFEKQKPEWHQKYYYVGKGIEEQWFDRGTDTTGWKPIKPAGNTWEQESELKDFDGAVWFRTYFDLPEGYTGETFFLQLLQIDNYDIVWVNGEKVAESYGKHNHRNYHIPTSLLKPKDNLLTVRVFDTGGIGGFTTNAFWGNPILWGNWWYKKGHSIDPQKFLQPVVPNATPFSSPAVLFNANIAPLTPMSLKGVIWYQGEANAPRAYEYRELFPALIRDWRKHWGQPELPFLFVQLANYKEEASNPKDDDWAELREAQAMALTLPRTGMATAIDIGEAADIHPKNKQEVGRRLSLVALKVAYEREVVASGPAFKQMHITNNKAILEFDHTTGGLITRDKHGYIRGFQMAGSDRKFYWAKAVIDGQKVIVTSEQVKQPVAVRYAWSSNPGKLDLYNKAGLPAVPFRTDQWKGITSEAKFKEGPRF